MNGVKDAVNATEEDTQVNEGPLYLGSTPSSLDNCQLAFYLDELRYFARELFAEEIEAGAYGALGSIEGYFVRLGCLNCGLTEASASCPEEYHLCYSIELHSGAYAVARSLGWTDWNSHFWTQGASAEDNEQGIGICCLDL